MFFLKLWRLIIIYQLNTCGNVASYSRSIPHAIIVYIATNTNTSSSVLMGHNSAASVIYDGAAARDEHCT